MTYSEWFSQYMSLYKRKISDKTRESYLRLAQRRETEEGNPQ